jgi:hypothetical protein
VAAVTAVLVSAVTYRYVEHPCLSSKLTLAAIELAASRKLGQLGAGLPAWLRLRVARLWHYMSARGAGARGR